MQLPFSVRERRCALFESTDGGATWTQQDTVGAACDLCSGVAALEKLSVDYRVVSDPKSWVLADYGIDAVPIASLIDTSERYREHRPDLHYIGQSAVAIEGSIE